MKLNALEQELVNIASIVEQTIGTAAAAKNPAYAALINTGLGLVQQVNAAVNPDKSAQATVVAADLSATIQPATTAVAALTSKTATPNAKAAALTTLFSGVELVAEDIWEFFKPTVTPVTPPATGS